MSFETRVQQMLTFYHERRRMPSFSEIAVMTGLRSKHAVFKLVRQMLRHELITQDAQGRLTHSTLGFVNRAARPDYRLFLDGAEVHMHNFSNQLTEGTAAAKVTGQFMGSGETVVGASFRLGNLCGKLPGSNVKRETRSSRELPC